MRSRLDVSLTVTDNGALVNDTPRTQGFVSLTRYTYSLLSSTVLTYSVLAATNVFTTVAHGLAVDDPIQIRSATGGAPLTVGVTYFVLTVPTADTFTVSTTAGGSTLNITTDGSGTYSENPSYTDAHHGIFFAPQRYGEAWIIDRVTVVNTSTGQVPTVYVMRGRVNEATAFKGAATLTYAHQVPALLPTSALVDYTPNGTSDSTDMNSPIQLSAGEYVSVLYAASQAGSTSAPVMSTVYLTGEVVYG